MVSKIIKISDILSLKINANAAAFNNILLYFPNASLSPESNAYDYQIFYKNVCQIENKYILNNGNKLHPFRNSTYFLLESPNQRILYANKQEFSEANAIIIEDKNIFVFDKDKQKNKALIRLITEIIIRKLLERQFFPIHSSCVVLNGKACLFFGGKGSGKSTALFSSVSLLSAKPLANDITFVGKENGTWKAFGTNYDLTFDKSIFAQLEWHKKLLVYQNTFYQYKSNKIRLVPKKFCNLFNTSWQWEAPIGSINFVNLNPNIRFVQNHHLSKSTKLKYLIECGKDKNFLFDDLLKINNLQPKYNYKQLISDILFNKIEGNIINHHKKYKRKEM